MILMLLRAYDSVRSQLTRGVKAQIVSPAFLGVSKEEAFPAEGLSWTRFRA